MKRMYNWFQDLALNKKITYLIIVTGIIPIGIIVIFSAFRLKKSSVDMQMYMLNKGFDQTCQSVESYLTRIYNVSTLATVNNQTLRDALESRYSDASTVEQLLLFESLSDFAYTLELNMEEANIIYYIDDSYLVASNQSSRYRTLSYLAEQDWYDTLQANKGAPTWVTMQEKNKYTKVVDHIGIVRSIWNEDDYTSAVGAVSVLTEVSAFEDVLIASLEDQAFILETAEGTLLCANENYEKYRELVSSISISSSVQFNEIAVNGVSYYIRKNTLDNGSLSFISIVPKASIYVDTSRTTKEMLLMFLLVCILLSLLALPMTKTITNRIKLLDRKMKEDGKLVKMEGPQHKDEIGRLITRYNGMVQRVDYLMEEQFLMGQEKMGAELKALQSQINPHFLYNTLDMLNWMAVKNETDNIQEALQAMSSFYRMVLSKGSDIIQIRDELRMCEAFMQIQSMRYKGKIQFEMEVQEEILTCMIPKITLQPLIENAVIHGIHEKPDGRGIIRVNGWIEEKRILLTVTDDGKGMDKENVVSEKPGGSHYGMRNIEKRLKLYYREDIKLHIDSSPGIGTCVSINIPVRT